MKSQLSIVEKRAISSKNLQNRLNLNKRLGTKNLTNWLFKRYKINKNDKILELGCGIGDHVLKEAKIVGTKGFIFATDYSLKSLTKLKKKIKSRNVTIKCIPMDNISNFLKIKNIKFDKIISSYSIYYAKDPIKVIKECSKFLKNDGFFLITAPCYPHTLTEFALSNQTLPKTAKKYIDFSKMKLEKFLKTSKINSKSYNFRNILKFKKKRDLINFYRSTVFYNKKSEKYLSLIFDKAKKRVGYFNILKSAKLYKFNF